jgi:hypothetical protein
MTCLLKYGTGMPLNRLDRLQSWLDVPLPASTQFDLIESVFELAIPAYRALCALAADAPLHYTDDTGVRSSRCWLRTNKAVPSERGCTPLQL